MKKSVFPVLFFIALFSGFISEAQDNLILRKRVAIVDFEDGSGETIKTDKKGDVNVKTQTNVNSNYGRVLTTMLTTELVKSNAFSVVERQSLDAIMAEQNLGKTGAVTPQSAAKLNQLLGVQLLITGSITEYGAKTNTEGTSVGRVFGSSKSKTTARVSVDIRILNASTGEILIAETASGTAEASSKGQKVFGIGKTQTSDDETLIDSAVRKAVAHCVALIKTASNKVTWEGSIVQVNEDGTLFIKPGSNGGVKTGMTLFVYRRGESVIDPETGLSLGSEMKKIGSINVLNDIGEGKAAKAEIKEGKGVVKKGDVLKAE